MNSTIIEEISGIQFGQLSAEEIKAMSVCEILSSKKTGYNTVSDPRMGAVDNNMSPCQTCGEFAEKCTGHWGYIQLNAPIPHPSQLKHIINILRFYCMKCYSFYIDRDVFNIRGLKKYKGLSRFQRLLLDVKKFDSCTKKECCFPKPTFKINTDGSLYAVYKIKGIEKPNIPITSEEIQKIFVNITDDELDMMGLNSNCHPKDFIITVLPVLPPAARPYVKQDGKICDDDLTINYCDIFKASAHLLDPETINSETKYQKYLQTLRFKIATMFDNSGKKAKLSTNNRPLKGIKERLSGKEGQVRGNLQGKRVDMTARTVAGPDTSLRIFEAGVPREIANVLTIPERVASYNYKKLSDLVNSGGANFIITKSKKKEETEKDKDVCINLQKFFNFKGTPLLKGDEVYADNGTLSYIVETGRELLKVGDAIKRSGVFLQDIKYPIKKQYKLAIGDVVERKLQNGDPIIVNRQPSLHRNAMQAMRVVILPGKTLRTNLAVTKSYNLDFDGDELNAHLPSHLEAIAELKGLSEVPHLMMNVKDSKPHVCIVQDGLLGSYRMTLPSAPKLTREQYFNMAMVIFKIFPDLDIMKKMKHIKTILKEKGLDKDCFNGRGLISLILPEDLIYEKKNDATEVEPIVKIYRGVMYEGTLDKSIVGSAHNSLIQIINKEYGCMAACDFIDGVQFLAGEWIMFEGFSIGIRDCMIVGEENKDKIKDSIQKCFIEAERIDRATINENIKNVRITAALNKGKDIGLRIAKEALCKDNNFISTVKSGSKGDFFNIAQITGLLGQQNLKGDRVEFFLNHGKRTLPHYPLNTNLEDDFEEQFDHKTNHESRGFISSSFSEGLNPREFYFHSMSARESIAATALGTAVSGYMQRRIVKLTEDMKIQYDGTVRDMNGNMYQAIYGDMGLDPACTIKIGSEQESCDVSRIINRLNMLHEIKK